MRKQIENELLKFVNDRSTITLDELQQLFTRVTTYDDFSTTILQLETDGILTEVKAQGRNARQPSLAYRYRISRHTLNQAYYKELQTYRHQFHQAINMDAYFSSNYTVWQRDLPYLKLIDQYIKAKGFPSEKAPAPERSFELVGNEKWIEEGGDDILRRTQLYDALNIYPVSDPLMFAINPNHITEKVHYHLIVENKTTYQGLLPALTKSIFSMLIYGAGNKISKTIENFPSQFPVLGEHIFFYFGDIDRSGITIWHSLHKRQFTVPAIPFYGACLKKTKAYGKTNQRFDEKSLQVFSDFFSEKISNQIANLLAEGAYFPQEVLQTKKLQHILLSTDWQAIKQQFIDRKDLVT